MEQHQFAIDRPDGAVACLAVEPDTLASHPALMLLITNTRDDAMFGEVHRIPADIFLAAGHRVFALDLPRHGDRVRPGERDSLAGMHDALMAGDDPFARFCNDVSAALDECARRGWVAPGRVVANGTSRGGYCALRAAAHDDRIAAVAANAPVTDWSVLADFAPSRDDPRVKSAALMHSVDRLVDRPVCITIGADDRVVSTARCVAYAATLFDAQSSAGRCGSALHVDPHTKNHRLADEWYGVGARFLLDVLDGGD